MADGDRVVYVLRDAGRPNLVKVGKDSGWPIRFSQACCMSPREMVCVALWRLPADESLIQAEKDAKAGLRWYDTGNGNTEWFVADTAKAVSHVESKLGRPPDETEGMPGAPSWHTAEPWDAWRDYAHYVKTKVRRRLWVGAEVSEKGEIGTLKAVHSPYYDGFFQFTPTYACARLRWLGWWQVPGGVTEEGNRAVYDLWHRIVADYGQGADDMRVGWLREPDGSPSVDLPTLADVLCRAGLVAGDPTASKPTDARTRDPSMGGKKPIPFGAVPPQRLVHRPLVAAL